ncbi:MAG TPA: hypothetical protein VFC80_06035 [Sphaerochaeta sp.]|nr:hypothetical protein [Sphaerochaeta sp.]
MHKNGGWREDQKELTRDILERVDIVSFSVDAAGISKGCRMDHLDGSHGYVTLEDALAYRWRVFDHASDVLLGTYDSIDALLAGGWKVST